MDHKIKARLEWIKLFQATNNAGLVCRRCGVSRPTLRKWIRRFAESGEKGLEEKSHRPKTSPNQKVFDKETKQIVELRKRRLSSLRIQNELFRNYGLSFSRTTLAKVLKRFQVPPPTKESNPKKKASSL